MRFPTEVHLTGKRLVNTIISGPKTRNQLKYYTQEKHLKSNFHLVCHNICNYKEHHKRKKNFYNNIAIG